ncbi:unnamed protein product [Phaedon cochleariae]|uniref:DUF4371 domain-containing protein n=1 Tax=Phaedon cochleariae TaxID=80249 RepID=A0A9P0DLM2_PHACE|nr:unnamed protein product [Phaedon cochleariae]
MDKFVFKINTKQHSENTQSDPVPSTSKVAEPEPIAIIEVDEELDEGVDEYFEKENKNENLKPNSEIARGVCLKRQKATRLIVGVLAPYFMKETIADIKENYFSIIIDETTELASQKSMVVIFRYWKEGKVTDRLLDLIEVHSATGESLFNTIKSIMDRNGIPYGKIIGFAADNASTMMRVWQGVQARLRELVPNIYIYAHAIHCTFVLQLLPRNCPNQLNSLLGIYSYFSHSSKRIAHLQECQIFSNEKPHKMLYPNQTRLLLEHWNSLRLFFQREALEDNLPSARAILNALNNQEYKIYFLFLSYVLELITKVNIELQSETPKLPIFLNRITTLYKTILKCFIKKTLIQKIETEYIDVNNPSNYVSLENVHVGAKLDALIKSGYLNLSLPVSNNFRQRALDFYVEFCNQVKQIFKFNDPYLKYASNFTPDFIWRCDVNC